VTADTAGWEGVRTAVVRDAFGVGIATGAYGLSFGAIGASSGFSILQTCAMSLLMFTGASQFALVGVIGGGGNPLSGAFAALLLGSRNALYGLRLAPTLSLRGVRRLLGAQFVIDESSAMAFARSDSQAARLAFWATGLAVFACWNLATLIGAVGAASLADPTVLGLDAAVPAAFLALLWPRLRSRQAWAVALTAAAVALVLVPFVPGGVPILAAALVAVGFGLRGTRARSAQSREPS
jgi:predicted branched-subunit amino acid permease